MEGRVVFNSITKLFDLIIEINGTKETISTSKNYGHWQYHLNRGTLPKSVAKHGITKFVYIGFTPNEPAPSSEPPPPVQVTEVSWFCTTPLFSQATKKRGRPRKYLPKVSGVIVHKMSDSGPPFRLITATDRNDIERNFRMFKQSMSNKEALQEIVAKFQVPYKQAYEIVVNFL